MRMILLQEASSHLGRLQTGADSTKKTDLRREAASVPLLVLKGERKSTPNVCLRIAGVAF